MSSQFPRRSGRDCRNPEWQLSTHFCELDTRNPCRYDCFHFVFLQGIFLYFLAKPS